MATLMETFFIALVSVLVFAFMNENVVVLRFFLDSMIYIHTYKYIDRKEIRISCWCSNLAQFLLLRVIHPPV